LALDTGQSLPQASLAPVRTSSRNGYCQAVRSGPRNGMVSSVICGSLQAHSGWALAVTPSAWKRGTSSGWITCLVGVPPGNAAIHQPPPTIHSRSGWAAA